MSILALYRVSLTEHERGWGLRPDGYIFTMSREDAQEYIKDSLESMPKDYVPDCYISYSEPELFEFKTLEEYTDMVCKIIKNREPGRNFYWTK